VGELAGEAEGDTALGVAAGDAEAADDADVPALSLREMPQPASAKATTTVSSAMGASLLMPAVYLRRR
jgi:L-aminopeptidase/D-esterase-like protein